MFLCCQAPVCVLVHLSIRHVLVRDAGCSLRCEDGAIRPSDPNQRQQLREARDLFSSNQYQAEGRHDYPLQVWFCRMHWSLMPPWPREHLSWIQRVVGSATQPQAGTLGLRQLGLCWCAASLFNSEQTFLAHLRGLLTRETMAWGPLCMLGLSEAKDTGKGTSAPKQTCHLLHGQTQPRPST